MSTLRHRFSNERWGVAALNHLPLLCCKSVYYDYDMCCLKREMNAPKKLKDSKQKHEEWQKIKELSEKQNTDGARKI